MSVIFLFNGAYTDAEKIVESLAAETGYKLISDDELIAEASNRCGIDKGKMEQAVYGKPSVFNKFTQEKERAVAHIKSVLADRLLNDQLILAGHLGHLIPEKINHVLKCLVIADMKHRTKLAASAEGLSEAAAVNVIHKKDKSAFRWTDFVHGKEAWDPSLYDIILPAGKTEIGAAVNLIKENLAKDVVQVSAASNQAVLDFGLAAQTELLLTQHGHAVDVSVDDGNVLLTINKKVLLLSKLEDELKGLVGTLSGVQSVKTKVGKDFHQSDIYRSHNFELPSKVLLVDDETEFVQVLSERLLIREVGSHVVFDGEQALELLKDEEPEVMVLDLKMPGIDGIEVLRQVKETKPNVEVIILTGKGSEEDKKRCMELGAFAYLEKPVDIEVMTKTMKEAYAKISKNNP